MLNIKDTTVIGSKVIGGSENLTEKRRIEKARTPIRRRMKKDRTPPKALRKVLSLEGSVGAAIDGQNESLGSIESASENGVFKSRLE